MPGTAWIGHNYAVPSQPWPTGKDGRDLAFYKNHANMDDGSFFVTARCRIFPAATGTIPTSDTATGRFTKKCPGQKFFRWSLSRAGAIWESLLTDSDGQYLRAPDRAPFGPERHRILRALLGRSVAELYFPYKKIGPMVKATPYGALNVRQAGGVLVVSFCALQKIDEKLVVRAGGKEIYTDRIVLKPMEMYEKRIRHPIKKGDLRVEVGDKLSYTDDPNDGVLRRPLIFRNYDASSLEGLYQSAERDDRERKYESALEKYSQVPGAGAVECPRADAHGGNLWPPSRVQEGAGVRAQGAGLRHVRSPMRTTFTGSCRGGWTTWWMPRRRWDGRRGRCSIAPAAYSELGGIYVDGGQPAARRGVSAAFARIRRQQRADIPGSGHGLSLGEAAGEGAGGPGEDSGDRPA